MNIGLLSNIVKAYHIVEIDDEKLNKTIENYILLKLKEVDSIEVHDLF